MRGRRIGFGLSLGLGLLAMSLGQCSFSLDALTVCSDDLGCKSGVDQRPPIVDMRDPNDPSMNGAFSTATVALNPVNGLADQLLLAPSDDGTTISTKQANYPLVLIAPPKGVALAPMRPYADRLASQGFVVGMYYVSDQNKDASYRDTGLAFLDAVLNGDAKDHIDSAHIGLLGYQLSAKISAAMAVARQTAPLIDALFLIEPADLFSSEHLDATATMAQLRLPNNATPVILGDPRSTAGSAPCIQSPQKGYADFYSAAQPPALSIVYNGANLGDFIANYPDPACVANSTAPQSQTQSLAIKYATAYFQWTLKGSSRAHDYLVGADFSADAQSAMLTAQSK